LFRFIPEFQAIAGGIREVQLITAGFNPKVSKYIVLGLKEEGTLI